MEVNYQKEWRDRASTRKKATYEVNNSYGVYDYYKYYIKNRPKDRSYYKMDSAQYYKLLRRVNEYLMDILFTRAQVVLPCNFGELSVLKKDVVIKFDEDGKLKTNRPINWDATIKLWFEDPEAEAKKTFVRWDNKEIITIRYKKSTAKYENSPFYNLAVTKTNKKKLAKKIKEEEFDTPFFIGEHGGTIKSLYNG